MSVLAVIPARGGSVGIPRKNLRTVLGHPLIWWTIQAAIEATTIDRVVVSTDDDEIAAVAVAAGAEVPFRRPSELAGPTVADLPVFVHTLAWLQEHEGYRPELVVHLRPTSPVRPAGLVDRAVDQLRSRSDASSLRSVSVAPETPWKMWDLDAEGMLVPLLGTLELEAFNQPRQQLPVAWLHNGVIDVIRPGVIEQGSMSGSHILAFPTDECDAIDIDNPDDLERASAALRDHCGRADRPEKSS